MDISKIKRDTNKISEGQWVSDIPEAGDLKVRVRGMSSPIVQSLMSRKLRSIAKVDKARDGSPKLEVATRITAEVIAEAVLLDWDGLTDDGNEVKYSKALATEWLTNPDYKEFADAVAWAARAVDAGDAEIVEAVEGN